MQYADQAIAVKFCRVAYSAKNTTIINVTLVYFKNLNR